MKIKKRFYVGSVSTITNGDWTHRTIEEAIEHAKRLVEDSDEEQYIVQVIRVVRRKSTPVIVEKVE